MDKTYPVHYKKVIGSTVDTQYAHNAKDEQKWQEAGYTDDHRLIPIIQFPCLMYSKEGVQVKCNDETHQHELLADGYSKTPIMPKPVARSTPASAPIAGVGAASQVNFRIEAIEEALEQQRADVAEIKEAVMELLRSRKTAPVKKDA